MHERVNNKTKTFPCFVSHSYLNAIHGVMRVYREEGFCKLFAGVEWASARAVMVTIGQICCYDIIKGLLLDTEVFEDNLISHFLSSFLAVSILY